MEAGRTRVHKHAALSLLVYDQLERGRGLVVFGRRVDRRSRKPGDELGHVVPCASCTPDAARVARVGLGERASTQGAAADPRRALPDGPTWTLSRKTAPGVWTTRWCENFCGVLDSRSTMSHGS